MVKSNESPKYQEFRLRIWELNRQRHTKTMSTEYTFAIAHCLARESRIQRDPLILLETYIGLNEELSNLKNRSFDKDCPHLTRISANKGGEFNGDNVVDGLALDMCIMSDIIKYSPKYNYLYGCLSGCFLPKKQDRSLEFSGKFYYLDSEEAKKIVKNATHYQLTPKRPDPYDDKPSYLLEIKEAYKSFRRQQLISLYNRDMNVTEEDIDRLLQMGSGEQLNIEEIEACYKILVEENRKNISLIDIQTDIEYIYYKKSKDTLKELVGDVLKQNGVDICHFVVNTHNASQSYSHFTALTIFNRDNKKFAIYQDSFGDKMPHLLKNVLKELEINDISTKGRQIQEDGDNENCGRFTALFFKKHEESIARLYNDNAPCKTVKKIPSSKCQQPAAALQDKGMAGVVEL